MQITIKEADIKKTFSASGMLIDELAYSINEWTSDDLHENNLEYEPNEPYQFNFERDLFEQTKTPEQLYKLANTLDVSINANWARISKEKKLQAGACVALNNPHEWDSLLEVYTQAVKEQNEITGDIISPTYQKELEKAVDEFNDDLYLEWLWGDRSSDGVVYKIQKHYEAEKVTYDEKNPSQIVFEFDDELLADTLRDYDELKLTKKNAKSWLLDQILSNSEGRKYKDRQEWEKRKAERERLATYRAEQEKEAEARRKAELLAMVLK